MVGNAEYVYDNKDELLEEYPHTCFTISKGGVVDNAESLKELDSRLEELVEKGIITDEPYCCDLGPEPLMGR